jgi:hypothetical protein
LKENCEANPNDHGHTLESVGMSKEQALLLLDASLITMALHTGTRNNTLTYFFISNPSESRIASLIGQAFYTIGPCGEELISAVGLVLRNFDPIALHYRHVGAQIARQLASGRLSHLHI